MTESLAWTCRCGAWCWNHHTNCAACGTEKPTLPPEAPPTDEARPEAPWRMEDVQRLEDEITRLWIGVAKGMIDRAPPADGRRIGDTLVFRPPTRDKRGYRA